MAEYRDQIASNESSNNPYARGQKTSSVRAPARGRYQLTATTAEGLVRNFPEKFKQLQGLSGEEILNSIERDPALQDSLQGALEEDQKRTIKGFGGKQDDPSTNAMMHRFGTDPAKQYARGTLDMNAPIDNETPSAYLKRGGFSTADYAQVAPPRAASASPLPPQDNGSMVGQTYPDPPRPRPQRSQAATMTSGGGIGPSSSDAFHRDMQARIEQSTGQRADLSALGPVPQGGSPLRDSYSMRPPPGGPDPWAGTGYENAPELGPGQGWQGGNGGFPGMAGMGAGMPQQAPPPQAGDDEYSRYAKLSYPHGQSNMGDLRMYENTRPIQANDGSWLGPAGPDAGGMGTQGRAMQVPPPQQQGMEMAPQMPSSGAYMGDLRMSERQPPSDMVFRHGRDDGPNSGSSDMAYRYGRDDVSSGPQQYMGATQPRDAARMTDDALIEGFRQSERQSQQPQASYAQGGMPPQRDVSPFDFGKAPPPPPMPSLSPSEHGKPWNGPPARQSGPPQQEQGVAPGPHGPPPDPMKTALQYHAASPDGAGLFDDVQRQLAQQQLQQFITPEQPQQHRGQDWGMGLARAFAAGGHAAGVEPLSRAYESMTGDLDRQRADERYQQGMQANRAGSISDMLRTDQQMRTAQAGQGTVTLPDGQTVPVSMADDMMRAQWSAGQGDRYQTEQNQQNDAATQAQSNSDRDYQLRAQGVEQRQKNAGSLDVYRQQSLQARLAGIASQDQRSIGMIASRLMGDNDSLSAEEAILQAQMMLGTSGAGQAPPGQVSGGAPPPTVGYNDKAPPRSG